MDRRSAPIITLSLAFSKSSMVTKRLPVRAAISAASLTRLARSAPEKPGRAARDHPQVDVRRQRHPPRMHREDLLAPLDVGVGHLHLPVEPARAQQRRVEHVRPVGRGDQDHALVRLEAVHLDQQLVQRLLALVVAAAVAGAAVPADRVDLVDEHDAGRVLLRLLEHVAHAADAPTPTNISTKSEPEIEKNGTPASPAMARASSVLPVPGGPTSSAPLGILPPRRENFCGSRRNSTISSSSSLASSMPATSLNVTLPGLLGQQLRLRLAEAHGAAAPAALHPVHEEDPDADQQQERQPQPERRDEARLLLRRRLDLDAVLAQVGQHVGVARLDGLVGDAVDAGHVDPLAVEPHRRHLPLLDPVQEVRVADLPAHRGAAAVREDVEQRNHQQEKDDPERDILGIAHVDVSSSGREADAPARGSWPLT